MNPILLDETMTLSALAADRSLGRGMLSETISASVHEVANGEYTAEIVYPVTGRHYSAIHAGGLVKLKPNDTADLQIFRIKSISKPLNGKVTLYLNHISYDLNKTAVLPCSSTGATGALAAMQQNLVQASKYPFTYMTDKSGGGRFEITSPRSMRACIGGQKGSFLDLYGGEIEWDNLAVKIWSHRGTDNGVTIRYAKNLTGLKFDESIESVYTAVLPFATVTGADGQSTETVVGNLRTIVNADEPQILPLDLSSAFQGDSAAPTVAEIDAACERYVEANDLSSLKVSADVNFIPLWQTAEYRHIAPLERVSLFDTVHVYHPKLGVSLSARVTETEYDCCLERYKKIHLGHIKATIASTLASQQKEVQQQKTELTSWWQDAIKKNTDTMNGVNGGYKYVVTDAQGRVVEEYWMDTPSIETAVNVRRENFNGIAYSHNGINGPFVSAWLMDGSFTAELMQTLRLRAQQIVAGELAVSDEDGNETFYVNVDTGEVRIVADRFSLTSGKTLGQIEQAQQAAIIAKETLYLVTYGDTPTQSHVGWTKTPLALEPGQHLWSMEKTTYLSGQVTYSTPVDLSGPELVSSERYYKLSASSTSPNVDGLYFGNEFSFGNDTYLTEPGEREGLFLGFFLGNDTYLTVSPETLGWQSTYPEYIQDRYLWERWKFVYKDGTVLWSEPVVNRWYFDMSTDIAQHYEEMHTSFTQTNAQIALKADKNVVDANYRALTGEITRVEQAQEASLTIESARIQGIVSETIRETTSQIEQQYGEAIETAISTSERTLRSEITQTANSITLELTGSITTQVSGLRGDLETLSGTVSTNNTNYVSQFELLQNQINARVTSTTLNTTVNAINQSIELAKSEVEAEISATAEGITLEYQGAISDTESTLTSNYTTAIATAKSQIESGYAGAIATAKGEIEDDYEAAIEVSETAYSTELGLIRGQIAMKASQTDLNARLDETGKLIDALRTEQSAQLNVATDSITAEISRLETKVDSNGNRIDSLDFARAYLKTDGLYVEDSLNPSKSQINGAGLKVIDTASNAAVLEATADGVTAKQLTTKGEFTIDSDGLRLVQKKWYNSYDNEYGIGFFVTGN